jgi:hypothetical protein
MASDKDQTTRTRQMTRLLSEWGFIALAAAMFAYAFYSIYQAELTPQETNLFAIVLTVASVLVSWLMTRMYSRYAADSNIRDNNVQVGNSVNNLKSQIRLLTRWISGRRNFLSGKGQSTEYDLALDHIEQTLISIDNQITTTLQSIGSIIGDSDRQYGELIIQIQNVVKEKQQTQEELDNAISPAAFAEYESKLATLEEKIVEYTDRLSSNDPPQYDRGEETSVSTTCPNCGYSKSTRMYNRAGETKMLACENCGALYNVHAAKTGFFTRIQGEASNGPITRAEVDAGPPVAATRIAKPLDLLSPTGFDYTSEEYHLYSAKIRAYLSAADAGRLSANDLTETLYSSGSLGNVTKTRVRRFVQLLFWSRLFKFDTIPSFSSPIINSPASIEMANAFCRAIGYRIGSMRVPLDQIELRESLKNYFTGAEELTNLEQLVSSYQLGYNQGLQGLPVSN